MQTKIWKAVTVLKQNVTAHAQSDDGGGEYSQGCQLVMDRKITIEATVVR